MPFWELPYIVRLEYLIGESLDRTGLRKKFWASHTGRTVEFSIGCKIVGLKSYTGWGSIPLGTSHFPTTMFGQPTRTLSPYRQARSFTRLLLDSIAVSIFVLVELINTVFVHSTDISTNIETEVLSSWYQQKLFQISLMMLLTEMLSMKHKRCLLWMSLSS